MSRKKHVIDLYCVDVCLALDDMCKRRVSISNLYFFPVSRSLFGSRLVNRGLVQCESC